MKSASSVSRGCGVVVAIALLGCTGSDPGAEQSGSGANGMQGEAGRWGFAGSGGAIAHGGRGGAGGSAVAGSSALGGTTGGAGAAPIGCGKEDCHWCRFVKTNQLDVNAVVAEEEEDHASL